MNKIRVGILFGGRSAEHDVSLKSAKNVIEAIDKDKYELVPIGISKTGQWHRLNSPQLDAATLQMIATSSNEPRLSLMLGDAHSSVIENQQVLPALDVVFPILHGSYGEDGTVQGLLRMADIPFVGADVLGSAIGMDKEVAKRLLREAGIPVAKFIVVRRNDRDSYTYKKVTDQLGSPVFVKAVNMGSSVGIAKVKSESEFVQALEEAFRYDTKVIIEEAIIGRELECAVLGNDQLAASVVGEIIPHDEFYTYDAKYSEGKTTIEIPAKIPEEKAEELRQLAIKTAQILECQGMARVDFFLEENGRLLVNEINTIPGFTSTSMYPKLWEATGIIYAELIDKLIQLALERHQRTSQLEI